MIGGEAGVGKTALARAFIARLAGDVRVFWGGCDPFSTPRPLAPFLDMQTIAPLVQRRLRRHELFTAILDSSHSACELAVLVRSLIASSLCGW